MLLHNGIVWSWFPDLFAISIHKLHTREAKEYAFITIVVFIKLQCRLLWYLKRDSHFCISHQISQMNSGSNKFVHLLHHIALIWFVYTWKWTVLHLIVSTENGLLLNGSQIKLLAHIFRQSKSDQCGIFRHRQRFNLTLSSIHFIRCSVFIRVVLVPFKFKFPL